MRPLLLPYYSQFLPQIWPFFLHNFRQQLILAPKKEPLVQTQGESPSSGSFSILSRFLTFPFFKTSKKSSLHFFFSKQKLHLQHTKAFLYFLLFFSKKLELSVFGMTIEFLCPLQKRTTKGKKEKSIKFRNE